MATPDWMQYIQMALTEGQLNLARDQYNNIQLPTSYGNLTGMLPGNYPGYAGMPTADFLSQSTNMFGRTGSDPRYAAMGYAPGTQTLGGRQMTLAEQTAIRNMAAQDSQMSMQYGGTYIAGSPAPPWMASFGDVARVFAAQNGGRQPNQQELTNQVNQAVNSSLDAIKGSPEYLQGDRNKRVQMESEAIAGSLGMDPQNAANFINELRQGTEQGRGPSSPQDIMQSAARWMAPSDPAAGINNAMTQLRNNPQYLAADGAGRRQMEAAAIQQVLPNLSPDQATQVVTELRAGSAPSNTLSSNDRINQVIGKYTSNVSPMYGQNSLAPPSATGAGTAGVAGSAGAGGGTGTGAGGSGSINYGGSGLAGGGNTPMSPEQRALNERGREFDVGAQLSQRSQDIDRQLKETDQKLLAERQAQQKAIEDGNLDLARQHEANITSLEQQKIDISKQGQDADIALRAAETMGVKSAEDVFQSVGRARSLQGTTVQDIFDKFQGARGNQFPTMGNFAQPSGMASPYGGLRQGPNQLQPPGDMQSTDMGMRAFQEREDAYNRARNSPEYQSMVNAHDAMRTRMDAMTPEEQHAFVASPEFKAFKDQQDRGFKSLQTANQLYAPPQQPESMDPGQAKNFSTTTAGQTMAGLPGMSNFGMLRPPDQFGVQGHDVQRDMINPVGDSTSASMGIRLQTPTQMSMRKFGMMTPSEQGIVTSAFTDQTKGTAEDMRSLMTQGNPTQLGTARRGRMV